MSRWTLKFGILLLLGAGLLPCAAEAKPEFEAELSRQTVSAEESAVLRVAASWPKSEASYTFALPELPLKNLTLVRQGESNETFQRGGEIWTQKTFEFELLPTAPAGEGLIDVFELSYIDPAVQKGGRFSIPSRTIRIQRAGRGRAAGSAAGLVLSLAAVAAGIFYLRRRAAKPPA